MEKRVCFDFEVDFSNGGGLQGQGFRIDIEKDDISEDDLIARIIGDMRLLMVGSARILNKSVITEAHKGKLIRSPSSEAPGTFVDLSHAIEAGMITYKGLPAPLVCDHISHIGSRGNYAEGTEFQIGKIDMVGNTGTYVDVPYHRFSQGDDLQKIALDNLAYLPGVVVRLPGHEGRSIDWMSLAANDIGGKAVLIETGWSNHWGTDRYFEEHPYLTAKAAAFLRDNGAALVGIDSLNIDDTTDAERPVHTDLLGAGIPIVEHLTNLGSLPTDGFRFWAVPPKIHRMGTFSVRAHALI